METKLYWLGATTVSYLKGVVDVFNSRQINEELIITVDESSTQCGICIATASGNILAIMDVINNGLPRDDFIRFFRKWFRLNFSQYKIKYIVCERAEQNAPQMYVRKLLQKLITILEDFASDYDAEFYQIDNKTWKKHFLSDDCYKGQRIKTELVKLAVVDRACRIYEPFRNYYAMDKGTDSADAIGILYGFLKECFVNGNWKVCTIMPTYPKRKYSCVFMEIDELKDKVSNGIISRNTPIVKYNPEYTFEDNARKIINFFDNGAILYTDDEKTLIGIWQNEADMKLSNKAIVYIYYSR